jgi:hypothetical protein
MNEDDYAAFLVALKVTLRFQREWRYGQTVANVLNVLRPDLRRRIWSTDLDPFNHDNRVPRLLSWLQAGARSEPVRRP